MSLKNLFLNRFSNRAATPSGKDKRKPVKFLIEMQRARAQKDIANWRRALNTAENIDMPRRYLLYDVYREIILDAHLHGEIELRKNKVMQSRYDIFSSNGDTDEELTKLLARPWFFELMNHLLDARFWGHTLVQIDDVLPLTKTGGGIQSITLVPREHIEPVQGLLLRQYNDTTGIAYRDEPHFKNWIIETPGTSLGLLNQAAPHALYKRFAQGAWSEFSELFGMPLRVGKTNTRDTTMIAQMEDMLRRMGSSAFAVIDEQETLEFIETTKSNGEVFESLMRICDSQLSKLITGAVIGGDGPGGSRSKEEVGERLNMAIVEADKDWLAGVINERVLPVLIAHGYPLEGCEFVWEQHKDVQTLWNNTVQALQYYEVDEDWVRNTFGIQVTGTREIMPFGNELSHGIKPDSGFFD